MIPYYLKLRRYYMSLIFFSNRYVLGAIEEIGTYGKGVFGCIPYIAVLKTDKSTFKTKISKNKLILRNIPVNFFIPKNHHGIISFLRKKTALKSELPGHRQTRHTEA